MNRTFVDLSNGTRIAYLERSGGDVPLLLLHGITDNANTWLPVLDGIDPRYHVYAMDFRGHGDSDKPEARYTTDAYADDVRAFLNDAIGAPAVLVGHSLGGVVAVQVAVTAADRVVGLGLEDPPLYFVNNLSDTYRALFTAMLTMSTTLKDGSHSRREWYDTLANTSDPFTGRTGMESMGEDGINERLDSLTWMKPKALADGLDGALEWDTDAVLEQVRCPVLLMAGNPDLGAVITPEEASRAAELMGNCRVVEFPDVGHLIHDQQPQVWLQALNVWLHQL